MPSELLWICAELAGRRWEESDPHAVKLVLDAFSAFQSAKPAWDKPTAAAVRDGVVSLRENIRRLITQIEALDKDAMLMAIRAARNTAQIRDLDRELREAIMVQDRERINQLQLVLQTLRGPPLLGVDHLAIQSLRKLEDALQLPKKAASREAPVGRGKPRDEWAYRTALIAARFYRDVTGERPTYWKGSETRFTRFVSAIYIELGIKAKLEGPVKEALAKMDDPDTPDPVEPCID